MASVEIVTIGTEILLGHMTDTNSVYIAGMLADHGVDGFRGRDKGNPDLLSTCNKLHDY